MAVSPLSFPSAEPGEDIARVARLKQVPLVLIGMHRSALLGETLGGATGAILRGSPADVGVLVDRGLGPVRHVGLVAGEGVHARAAARFAERLASEAGVQVKPVKAGANPGDVDLVVAPFGARAAIPEGGTTSWLLVHAAEA
jgi:hypothetical protein